MIDIDWEKYLSKKRAFRGQYLKNKLNPQMRDWILPPWFEKQNNPLETAFSSGTTDFINLANRNWITIFAESSDNYIIVDLYGTIHIPKIGISMETWVRSDNKIITPGNYLDIYYKLCPIYRGLGFIKDYISGSCKVILFPTGDTKKPLIQTHVSIVNKRNDFLKPMELLFVVRPFDNNGISLIQSLEYKDHYLFVNGKKIFIFEKVPSFSFFSNANGGDVTQYFELGEGNEKIHAMDGTCTGMLGYSGLPEELKNVKLCIVTENLSGPKSIFKLFKKKTSYREDNKIWMEKLSQNINLIKTNTRLDEMYLANLVHFETFQDVTDEINIYQILVYNRLKLTETSKRYLEMCLKKIRWDGSIAKQYLGTSQVIFAILDYYHFTGDKRFIETNWQVLERLGSWLTEVAIKETDILSNLNYTFLEEPQTFEDYFWICSGLKALAKLGMSIGKTTEIEVYREKYLSLKSKLLLSFTNIIKSKKKKMGAKVIENGNGKQMVSSLSASYPLQLFEINERVIQDAINLIIKNYLYNGAVVSPLDFKGIDLELTVRLGQVLVREGLNYNRILDSLLKYAGPAWSWPDRINPVSKEGIGKVGHDAKVIYQVLLLLRNIMVIEDDANLYLLPGIFNSSYWKQPQLKIRDLPTYFGQFSLNCRTLGNIIQIDYEPDYRLKPNKIRFIIPITYKVVFCDQKIQYKDSILETGPDFRRLRLRKD